MESDGCTVRIQSEGTEGENKQNSKGAKEIGKQKSKNNLLKKVKEQRSRKPKELKNNNIEKQETAKKRRLLTSQ